MRNCPTVQDHLQALGKTPDWVVELGQAIQRMTDCSTAIAAARARQDVNPLVSIARLATAPPFILGTPLVEYRAGAARTGRERLQFW